MAIRSLTCTLVLTLLLAVVVASSATATVGGATATDAGAAQRTAAPAHTADQRAAVPAHTADATPPSFQSNDTVPPDPAGDRLGWENGYWYNESVSVDRSDGLNDTELDPVVARSMARVEQIRRLEFQSTPPVAVITREQYRANLSERFANLSTPPRRLHQNVKYEALFMVGESTNAVAVQRRNLAGGVLGFYDPEAGQIKIISENTSTPKMDEITLSQELFHALQDQLYNTSGYNQSTRELHNARDGIIEGDGNYVDYLYQQRCESDWDCLTPQSRGGLSGFDPHQGLYRISLQPYSSGPAFVRDRHERRGWDAVNEVYEHPPNSSEQVIHPERYGEDEPTAVHIADTSRAPWHVLELNDSLNYAQFGEGGLFVALWYPGLESNRQTQIVPYEKHLNLQPSRRSLDPVQPLLYNASYTSGWDGDRLLPYVTNRSTETNETGYVYRTVWDSERDAAQFRDGWRQLMAYHGARPVPGHRNTFRIENTSEFGDAFSLVQNGTTVTIVNGPTVASLDRIHAGAAPTVESGQSGRTDTPDSTTSGRTQSGTTQSGTAATAGDETESGASGDETTPTIETVVDGPGFGVLLALVALLTFGLVVRRRW